jgi:hypothetical protein
LISNTTKQKNDRFRSAQFSPSLFLLLSSLLYLLVSCLNQGVEKESINQNSSFFLRYLSAGLGSGMGSMQPTIYVSNQRFVYTWEQNSYYGEKTKKPDTICILPFRQSSVDSILEIVNPLKDSTISRFNPCVMSGGVQYLTVGNGPDTVHFSLHNSADTTALKIMKILNQYAPADKQLWLNTEMLQIEKDCWEELLNDTNKKKSQY